MNSVVNLFSSIELGENLLSNRIVMAPMTRLRAADSLPTMLMAEYYAQRASAGLIITECTMVSPLSNGYMNCPGIYSAQQIVAWRQITEAVYSKGGKIFLQLWHCGRVSHPSLLNGKQPVAPSAIAATGTLHTPIGKITLEVPQSLETHQILEIVEQFRQAAQNAKEAGFDGIELHGAFGYLIDQFLQDGSNQRTDKYGGSIENRVRFLLEIVDAVTKVWGGGKVGIKLSPSSTFYGMFDSNPKATFTYLLEALNSFDLAYVHLMEPNEMDLTTREVLNPVLPIFRPIYKGTIMTNGDYNKAKGNEVINSKQADLVSFGRLFIANPDLPQRFEQDAPLNEPNSKTFYWQGVQEPEIGYTDYPVLSLITSS